MDKYFEILGLRPGASQKEIKAAYRDLAKVWHPDRFSSDPRLQAKAQEKLKEIIEAYEYLKDYEHSPDVKTYNSPNETETYSPKAVPDDDQKTFSTFSSTHEIKSSILPKIAAAVSAIFLIVVIAVVFYPRQNQNKVGNQVSNTNQLALSTMTNVRNANVPAGLAKSPVPMTPASPVSPVTANSSQSNLASTTEKYFTIGSSKQEVLAIQGTPDRFTDTQFEYGLSKVNFENGKVISWDVSYPKLNVRLITKSSTTANYFTVGSTKDEVIKIQGTPDRFTEDSFQYGLSKVNFKNGVVVNWDVSYPKLKVKMSQ